MEYEWSLVLNYCYTQKFKLLVNGSNNIIKLKFTYSLEELKV